MRTIALGGAGAGWPAGSGRRYRGHDRRLGLAIDFAAARGPVGRAPCPAASGGPAPGRFWPRGRCHGRGFERRVVCLPRAGARRDWVSRFILPLGRGSGDRTADGERGCGRNGWGAHGARADAWRGGFAFTRGWFVAGLALPCCCRRRSTSSRGRIAAAAAAAAEPVLARVAHMLWPAAGLALLALGWFEARHGGGWGAGGVAALAAAAFAEAMRIGAPLEPEPRARSISCRGGAAVLAGDPLCAWGVVECLSDAVLALYAATSFFLAQHVLSPRGARVDAALTPIV